MSAYVDIALQHVFTYCALARGAVPYVNHIYHGCGLPVYVPLLFQFSPILLSSLRREEVHGGEDICFACNVACRHSSTFSPVKLQLDLVELVMQQPTVQRFRRDYMSDVVEAMQADNEIRPVTDFFNDLIQRLRGHALRTSLLLLD
jgi:hypothetical protein